MGDKQSKEGQKSQEKIICIAIGSAFIKEIGGENSSLFELSSLPLLFRELYDDCLMKLFRNVGSSIITCGKNEWGQLGLSDTQYRNEPNVVSALNGSKIIQIACGIRHSLALLESGSVVTWGCNQFYQLGLGKNRENRLIPTEIPTLKGKKVTQISCGRLHTGVLTSENEVYSWGDNHYGQLGLDDKQDRNIPTCVLELTGKKVSKLICGFDSTFTILSNGAVFDYGWNAVGQLGLGDKLESKTIPQKVVSLSGKNVVSIASGYGQTLALTDNGEVLRAGDKNLRHNCFQETFEIVQELEGKKIISISCGFFHFLALTENGDLYSWGSNDKLQLGISYTPDSAAKPEIVFSLKGKHFVKMSCGTYHNFAITEAGEIFGWGNNEFGQLGVGNYDKQKPFPIEVKSFKKYNIIDITCGEAFTMALLE